MNEWLTASTQLDPEQYMARRKTEKGSGTGGRDLVTVLPPAGHGNVWNGAPRSTRVMVEGA